MQIKKKIANSVIWIFDNFWIVPILLLSFIALQGFYGLCLDIYKNPKIFFEIVGTLFLLVLSVIIIISLLSFIYTWAERNK